MICPIDDTGTLSPSLASSAAGQPRAYELKFLLDLVQAQQIESWAQHHLRLDPHGDPELGGAYRTTSLYCDTPQLDVYYRSPSYKRRKFRARRYGADSATFLERKSKRGDRVAKRRTTIHGDELSLLAHSMSMLTWSGYWFHRSLLERRLSPACLVAYQRSAYIGNCTEGPLRLTLDRHARGILANDWSLGPFEGGLPLLTGKVILELKFRSALPSPFKQIVTSMRLTPSTISKYRLCREAWGVPSALREVTRA